MNRTYLDNNATTPLAPAVREAMLPYLEDLFGNPSSDHRFGEAARAGVDTAREQLAGLLGCRPNRLVFTSGGTEANNQAIWSAINANPQKKHIITTAVEHASVLSPLKFIAGFGYEVEILPVDKDGGLNLQTLEEAIRPEETVLVSLMAANNETGVVWPIEEVGALCRNKSTLFHCDAVQMIGKLELCLDSLPVDYLSIGAHKFHGPKGIGALYSHRTAPLRPFVMGAGQERGLRAGTENVAAIAGLGMAAEQAYLHLKTLSNEVQNFRNWMEETIRKEIPDAIINGATQQRLPNTSNISFKHISSAALIQELEEKGFAVSAHSACHSGDLDPSHVLTAMHIDEQFIHGTLRVSLSRFNTEEEIHNFIRALIPAVKKLHPNTP